MGMITTAAASAAFLLSIDVVSSIREDDGLEIRTFLVQCYISRQRVAAFLKLPLYIAQLSSFGLPHSLHVSVPRLQR